MESRSLPENSFTALVEELRPVPDVEHAFVRWANLPHCLLLDSALRVPHLGRYSFLAADPFHVIRLPADGSDAFGVLDGELQGMQAETIPELPPFQGGAAGLFSYDLARSLEKLPAPRYDEFSVPAMAVGLYDVVLAFDHVEDRAWLISQGLPENDPRQRRDRAAERLAQFLKLLSSPATTRTSGRNGPVRQPALSLAELAPHYQVAGPTGLVSNFSAQGYQRAVQQAIDYIHAGDVFQVNLSQRLLFPAADDAVSLYLRLRQRNAATFAGYFDLGDFQICSASPERFLQVRDRRVEARPIKGTRARIASPEADLFAGDELMQSVKDRAENVMIADLMRNDISRVCRPESVRVSQLCGLETYAYVQHLVSVIEGTLRDECTPLECLVKAFPGGSITGAPKVRAMEIIAELEPTARGFYCGSLGYLGFDGTLDTNILIRTVTAGRGWWQLPVGGGIVAQSSPAAEYQETWQKAAGMLRSLLA